MLLIPDMTMRYPEGDRAPYEIPRKKCDKPLIEAILIYNKDARDYGDYYKNVRVSERNSNGGLDEIYFGYDLADCLEKCEDYFYRRLESFHWHDTDIQFILDESGELTI